ncbi:MAG: PorP/SprF family type IX secretion system membrane protein [Saprospiraceae bacterium]
MKKIIFAFTLVCFGFLMTAQDIHFSQFYMSPLNLNPALTGVMNCNKRFIGNFRNQWASVLRSNAYNTYSATYDQKIPVGRYDYFGIGGGFWGDVAGQLNFGTIQGKLSGSFSKRMAGSRTNSHYLAAGFDIGAASRSIDFTKAQYGSQHDGQGGFDPTLPGEALDRDQFIFADLNVGLLWFSVLGDNNFYGGVAYSHLNQPNQSFSNDRIVPLTNKITAHAGGELALKNNLQIVPGIVMFKQGTAFELNLGSSAKFITQKSTDFEQSFQFGAWVRLANHYDKPFTTDAVIVSSRFDFNQYGIGLSYDLNISSLRPASNGNGAFEISLIYNICDGSNSRGVYCPTF